MEKDWELYDEDNIEHNNKDIYEVVEWGDELDSDGRHPDYVEIGTIKDDAFRRDFTVNALYYNLHEDKLIDPTGFGINDIKDKLLRFVGKPKDRLIEDALRLWRAFRLSKTKGLKIERKTEKALRENFQWCYEKSNPARVLQEMIKCHY